MATQNEGKGNNTGANQGNTPAQGTERTNDPKATLHEKDTILDPQKRDTPSGDRQRQDDGPMSDDKRTPAPGQKPNEGGQEGHGKSGGNKEPRAADAQGKSTRDAAKPLSSDEEDARKPEARAESTQRNAEKH